MTPDKYLQTDEAALLEIAPHWRLLQVFPREPRELGHKCGAMFYIGVELEGRTSGKPDMASLLYGGPCLEETALALSALIPLMPGAKLVVLMMRNTKSGERHDAGVIWQATRSHDFIRDIRVTGDIAALMEHVELREGDKAGILRVTEHGQRIDFRSDTVPVMGVVQPAVYKEEFGTW